MVLCSAALLRPAPAWTSVSQHGLHSSTHIRTATVVFETRQEAIRAIDELTGRPIADRIVYTRDFLIALATCPESRKRPEFLPAHPIVLSNARDIEFLD
uniref:Uncharacterized protein n=1 Tax=Knipowitschia caucasica TaxID=637954 RepID=A0AAV2MCZ6_KNICA